MTGVGIDLHPESTSELDKVTSGNVVTGEERRERVNGVVDTRVRSEVGLDIREDDHRTVSTGAVELARQ